MDNPENPQLLTELVEVQSELRSAKRKITRLRLVLLFTVATIVCLIGTIFVGSVHTLEYENIYQEFKRFSHTQVESIKNQTPLKKIGDASLEEIKIDSSMLFPNNTVTVRYGDDAFSTTYKNDSDKTYQVRIIFKEIKLK